MLFVIPHLFPSARLLEAAAQDLRLPALQTLLARGRRQSSPAEGVEAALCEALGIARQQDWPVAPISLEADGGVAGEASGCVPTRCICGACATASCWPTAITWN